MTHIPEGYGLIAGRSTANAQAALKAADDAGVDQSEVTGVDEGYVVPQAVLDHYTGIPGEAPEWLPFEGSAGAPEDIPALDGYDSPTGPEEGSAGPPEDPTGGTGADAGPEDAAAVPASSGADAPTEEWTNPEIKDWAESHQVDLGDATKKADMLAAINAANTA